MRAAAGVSLSRVSAEPAVAAALFPDRLAEAVERKRSQLLVGLDPRHAHDVALRQMDQLRDQAQRMIERGENPTAEMEQQLDDLLSKVQVNSNYQRAIAAQENFDKTMLQVNNWITEGIRKGATSSIITLG